MTHPAIAIAAAVAMPDPVFGEKVCLYVELTDSATIDLPKLVEHLLALGVPRSCYPNDSLWSMNYPGNPAQRSPKAGSVKIFGPGWRPVMNARNARRGGLEVWAPSVVPPIGVDLSDEQALAVAFRHLAATGFAENMAGHITWQPDGHTDMFVNPWGLWWQD